MRCYIYDQDGRYLTWATLTDAQIDELEAKGFRVCAV